MLEQQRKAAGAEREEKMQEWLAEGLKVVKSTRTDWRDDEAGWEGVAVPAGTGWDRLLHCKARYVLWRWTRRAHNYWYSFVLEGYTYRGEGTLNRAWLRERLAQVQWKAKHCPDDDIATEEEDELLDIYMLYACSMLTARGETDSSENSMHQTAREIA